VYCLDKSLSCVYFKNKINPYYKKNETSNRSRYETITIELEDGKKLIEKKWWELSKCLKQFYGSNTNHPVRKNLEFFASIRNMIVHRNIPELDPNIYAECQANILNFNDFLKEHFGDKHKMDYMLSYTIQMFNSNKNFFEATKSELKKKNALEIVEFINEKDLTDEQKEQLKNMGIVLIKEKAISQDNIPANFTLTYAQLKEKVKKRSPQIQHNYFEKIKKYLRIRYDNQLAYKRIYNPKSSKSQCTYYYDEKIIDEFVKICPPINESNRTVFEQVIQVIDQYLSAKKDNPAADTSALEQQIDHLVYRLYELTEEEIRIIENKK
jgi:hypothetical protein